MDSILVFALRGLRDPAEPGDDRIGVLIKAVRAGQITMLECQMETCFCPNGRGYFTRRGRPKNGPWAPSADRWPLPGYKGGLYRPDNVRLAHRRCNQTGRPPGISERTPRRISPQRKAQLHERGLALAELNRTPERREVAREWGRVAGKIGGSRGGPARARRAQEPEVRARLVAALEKGRQTPEQLSANAAKANCVRWAIGRGKPCTCGQHS